LELDQGKGLPFQGNYSGWLEHNADRLKSEAKRKSTLESQMAKDHDRKKHFQDLSKHLIEFPSELLSKHLKT